MNTTIFIGTELGLYRLEKSGSRDRFSPQNIFPGKRIVDIAVLSQALFAAVSGEGVFRSVNFGNSWQQIFSEPPTCLQADSRLWVGTANCGLYRSPDGGDIWENLTPALHAANSADEWYPPLFADEPQVSTIAISPVTQTVMVGIKNGGTVLSTDGGAHWSLTDDLPDENVHRLRAHPFLPEQWLAGTGGGIFFSGDDGRHWEEMMAGIDLFFSTDVFISADGRYFAAASGTPPGNWVENSWSTLFSVEHAGDEWQPVSLPRAEYITVFAQADSQHLVFGTQSGAVYRETGREWQMVGQVSGAITALCGNW